MVNSLGQICCDTDYKSWKLPLLQIYHFSTTTVHSHLLFFIVLLTLHNSVKVWEVYLIPLR